MYNTNNGVSDGRKVIVPAEGHNYHLTADCYGIRLGQGYHASVGHDIYSEQIWTVRDAVYNSKFACRICYRKAGLEIPAEVDRVKVRAAARADRMAAKAVKAEAAPAAEDKLAEINAQVASAIATLKALIAMRNKAMRVAAAA